MNWGGGGGGDEVGVAGAIKLPPTPPCKRLDTFPQRLVLDSVCFQMQA